MIKIAWKYIIRSKNRTFVSVLGIAVSVMLMFSLMQMGDCVLRQFAHMTTSGLKRDFTIAGLSYDKLNESKNIMKNEGLNKNYMLSMNIGCWYENDYSATDIIGVEGNLNYFKDTGIIDGHTPSAHNEVCIEEEFNNTRKTPCRIGDKLNVIIENPASSNKIATEFVVSGIIHNIADDGQRIWTNLQTAHELLKELSIDNNKDNSIAVVADQNKYNGEKSVDLILLFESKLGLDNFYKDHLIINDQKINLLTEEKGYYYDISNGFKGLTVLITICIFVFAFNSFHISSIEKMNQLAAMRCIGISHKQQSRILLWEGCIIGNLGILIGFLCGNILNYFVAEMILNLMMTTDEKIPLVQTTVPYIETYITAMAAILLALFRILFKMRRMTILEAFHYTEKQKKEINKKNNLTPQKTLLWQMAKLNLQRNPLKSNTLTATMTISITLCLVILGIFFSIDISFNNKNAKNQIFQYELYKSDVLNPFITPEEYESVTQAIGTENVYCQSLLSGIEWDNSESSMCLLVYENKLFELLLEQLSSDRITDIKLPLSVLYSVNGISHKSIKGKNEKTGKHFDISIDVTLSKNENYAIYSSFGYDCDLLIINETMAEKLGFPVHGITGILLKNPNEVSSLTISDCFPNGDSTQVINLNKNRDSDQSQLLAILILASYIMLTTILLTCIIMSNTIRSNLLSRQSETAIMRAVGLTKKQNVYLCCAENIILLLRASLYGIIISTVILLCFGEMMEDGIKWNALLYIGVFTFFTIMVLCISTHTIKFQIKKTITQLLQEK